MVVTNQNLDTHTKINPNMILKLVTSQEERAKKERNR